MEVILNEKKDEVDKVDNSAKNIFGDLSNLSREELHKVVRMYLFGDGVESRFKLDVSRGTFGISICILLAWSYNCSNKVLGSRCF